jgi:hypothetical protein
MMRASPALPIIFGGTSPLPPNPPTLFSVPARNVCHFPNARLKLRLVSEAFVQTLEDDWNMKKPWILLIACLAAGCGGGGGGGGGNSSGDVPFFGGVWRGSVGVVSDNCNILNILNEPETLAVDHTVNQDGETVVLDLAGGDTLSGSVTPEKTGFKVFQPPSTTNNCVTSLEISYLVTGDENQATVGYSLESKCGTVDCTVNYVGQATRDH